MEHIPQVVPIEKGSRRPKSRPLRRRSASLLPILLLGVVILLVLGMVFVGKLVRASRNARTLQALTAQEAVAQEKNGPKGTFANAHVQVAGKLREYRLVVPDSVDPNTPVPLVFAYHGLLDSKDIMPMYSKLDDLARQEGFILVYPNARDRYWPLFLELGQEDLAFFDALYAHLTFSYNIDPARVFVTGMSNGAYFSHVVASQRSEKIAAIAPHSGGLGVLGGADIEVKHKYAVLAIHGDADRIVAVQESRKTCDAYEKAGHEVEYIEIAGLGHMWANQNEINNRIWKFFLAHPRR